MLKGFLLMLINESTDCDITSRDLDTLLGEFRHSTAALISDVFFHALELLIRDHTIHSFDWVHEWVWKKAKGLC